MRVFGPQFRLDVPCPVRVHPGDVHAQALEDKGDLVVGPIRIVKDDQVVPGMEVGEVHHGACRHARGADDAVFCALQGSYLMLHGPYRGIVVPVVGVAVDLAVGDLPEHLERGVLVVHCIDDGGDHGPVAVRG